MMIRYPVLSTELVDQVLGELSVVFRVSQQTPYRATASLLHMLHSHCYCTMGRGRTAWRGMRRCSTGRACKDRMDRSMLETLRVRSVRARLSLVQVVLELSIPTELQTIKFPTVSVGAVRPCQSLPLRAVSAISPAPISTEWENWMIFGRLSIPSYRRYSVTNNWMEKD